MNLILFDFDDTLAQTTQHIDTVFDPKLAELLQPYTNLSREEIDRKSAEFYQQHGASIIGWAHEMNRPITWAMGLFLELSTTVRDATLPHVHPDSEVTNALQTLQNRGNTLAILTHNHAVCALPLLEKMELSEIFPESHVFDLSKTGGLLKTSPKSYQFAESALGGGFAKKTMLEDSPVNLNTAKNIGYATILIGPHNPPAHLAPAIDTHVPTLHAALNHLLLS